MLFGKIVRHPSLTPVSEFNLPEATDLLSFLPLPLPVAAFPNNIHLAQLRLGSLPSRFSCTCARTEDVFHQGRHL